ncbi:MAG: VOC family protein [Synergistaceae bacterium]|jgi:predicted enzyme related to lactoylglutathione lyase|nr:VOC family protein [Synergistaceae bacterium]
MSINLTSAVTFLYFDDLNNARRFFSDGLRLETVYDPGWACIYRLSGNSFIGAVDNKKGSIEVKSRSGVLISLTVSDIDEAYEHVKKIGVSDLSDIKRVKDIDLESFFFTGPEGYKFEVERFTTAELRAIF